MFPAFCRPSSGAQWLQCQPLVLPLYRGDSRAVFVVGRRRKQHDCHHDTKVIPEAGTAVIELLMMGGKTTKTFWAVNKRQDNKLKNCCIWLVIYLNCTMMHELTNLKCISTDLNLVTWQNTVQEPPENFLKNGTETCRGNFFKFFNVNFSAF